MSSIDLLTVKEEGRTQTIQVRHEVVFICPTCAIRHVRTFVTGEEISAAELEDFIGGEKEDFYYAHVLNCDN